MERSDPEIRSDIVEALSRDSRVNTARITVAVEAQCRPQRRYPDTLHDIHCK